MALTIFGFLVPCLLGRTIAAIASVYDLRGGLRDAIIVPFLSLLMITAEGWRLYDQQRAKAGTTLVTGEDDEESRRRWNSLALASVIRLGGLFAWIVAGVAAVYVTAHSDSWSRIETSADLRQQLAGTAAIITLAGTIALIILVRHIASPHWLLVHTLLRQTVGLRPRKAFTPALDDFRVSRWRSSSHHAGFLLAKRVERCLPGLQRRLEATDANRVVAAFTKLAAALRRTGVRMADTDKAAAQFSAMEAAAFGLLIDPNLVRAAAKVEKLTRNEPESPPPEQGWMRRSAVAASVTIQAHWPTIKIIGFVVALVTLLATGKLNQAVGALLK